MTLASIRVALGLTWVVAARIAGASSAAAWLAFAIGVFAIAFVYFNDPRARFLPPRPPNAQPVALWRTLFPSTIGISVLAAIAVGLQPVLAACLGGVSAGLGFAGLLGTLIRR